MSRNSKAKRDQRKKQQPRRPVARLGRAPEVQNHAVMQDADGHVVAAIGLQGDEWLLAIGGQTMGNADNPVPMLAMLKHLSNVQEKEGRTVTLEYSPLLQQLLDALAAEQGVSADAYLAEQVAQFEGIDGEEAVATPDVAEGEGEAEPAADTEADDKPQA